MRNKFHSFIAFLLSSKKNRVADIGCRRDNNSHQCHNIHMVKQNQQLSRPKPRTIKTLGVEAYWDKNLENKTETINWGTIWPISSKNFTLYLRSISNTETTLLLNSTNWNPANISEYMNLSWNYNGTILHPSETIQVTLTLTTSSSNTFLLYLITNDVTDFNFDINISASEQIN